MSESTELTELEKAWGWKSAAVLLLKVYLGSLVILGVVGTMVCGVITLLYIMR